ncbi:hypothetical protein ILUMI_13980 [Ignelater luminosus]|uniref:Uncharacterized protein n=1 Tax=Ignelater luminosus TaxID=2038154 RepID=A0A8K0CRC1_IGNLU|nr:hypothetical protein ILUMI_13980 [Ignelater luminosus]
MELWYRCDLELWCVSGADVLSKLIWRPLSTTDCLNFEVYEGCSDYVLQELQPVQSTLPTESANTGFVKFSKPSTISNQKVIFWVESSHLGEAENTNTAADNCANVGSCPENLNINGDNETCEDSYKKTNDRVLHDTLSKTPKGHLVALPHGCLGKSSNGKIDDVAINDHIESFNPCVSHYRREHAPNVRYLSSDMTVSLMYKDFKEKSLTFQLSYETYRKKVKAKGISLTKLGQELCATCVSWTTHMDSAKQSRRLYQEHVDGKLFRKNKPYAVVWHKAISKRSKEYLISTFYAFFKSRRDATNIIIWNSFSKETPKILDFLMKKVMKKSQILKSVACLSEPLRFPNEKRATILKQLDRLLPENRKVFWNNLPTQNEELEDSCDDLR